jgi:hypothetical protein
VANVDEDQIIKLGQAISDPVFRSSIKRDLDETLKRHGVERDQIPQEVLETLTTLSPDEMAVLAKVKGVLTSANVSDHVKAMWV